MVRDGLPNFVLGFVECVDIENNNFNLNVWIKEDEKITAKLSRNVSSTSSPS